MKIEVVHIAECPNWEEAGRRLRTALDTLDARDVAVHYRLLTSSEDAATVWFAGSPTILIDDADAFPTGGRIAELACRVFYTDQGLSRLPTVEQLVAAVRAHER